MKPALFSVEQLHSFVFESEASRQDASPEIKLVADETGTIETD